MSPILTLGGSVATVDVRDYATFSAAVAAVSGYTFGRIRVPGGTYTSSTTPALDSMTWGASNSIMFEGDGPAATYLIYDQANTDLITINSSDFSIIKDMRIEGANSAGTGRCVVYKSSSYTLMDNVWIDKFPSWGIDFNDTTGDCVLNDFRKLRVTRNVANGCLRLGPSGSAKVYAATFSNGCHFAPAAGNPVHTVWAQKPSFRDCSFEVSTDVNQIVANGLTFAPLFDNCWFEATAATAANWHIHLSAGTYVGWNIHNCHFVRTGAVATARIFKSLGALRSCKISNPTAQTGTAPVGTDDLVFAAADECIVEGGRVTLTDGASNPADLTVSEGAGCQIYRIGGGRLRIPTIAEATRDALNNIQDGDIVSNAGSSRYQGYEGGGWRDLNTAP